MKKHLKKTYFQYFCKHLIILFLIGLLVFYAILQGIYFYLFSKIGQKTTANFYEGMETIQYSVKDASLMEVETEVVFALKQMSNAGTYYEKPDNDLLFGYHGELLGLRLDALEPFLQFSIGGWGGDGNGNTYLRGIGKAWGYIQDMDTGEVVTEIGKDWNYLYLIDRKEEDKVASDPTVVYRAATENILHCDNDQLDPLIKRLSEIKEGWWEYYQKVDPDYAQKNLIWVIESFYVKEDQFYPAKVSLYYEPNKSIRVHSEDVSDVLVEEYLFEPENKNGYSLYEIDYEKERAVATFLNSYGNGEGTSEFVQWKPDDDFRMEALEGLNSLGRKGRIYDLGGGWSVGNPLFYFYNGKMVFARYAFFQDREEHLYRACVYQTFSGFFFGDFYHIIWWGTLLILFEMSLAVFTAYLEYSSKRYRFMTEEYRRTLMDSMAHDLKSPLMAISGYAENLSEHIQDEKREHYAREIQKSVQYMNALIMKNLEILKLDQQKVKLIRREIDLRKLFEETISRYEGRIVEKKLQVTIDGEQKVKGDEALLEKAVDNLVGNAVNYTPEGGQIRISFEQKRIVITNQTELSYDRKTLKHLWEPFVRGENSRTGQGSGLGLSIVATVLDRHKWNYQLHFDREKKEFSCVIKSPLGFRISA